MLSPYAQCQSLSTGSSWSSEPWQGLSDIRGVSYSKKKMSLVGNQYYVLKLILSKKDETSDGETNPKCINNVIQLLYDAHIPEGFFTMTNDFKQTFGSGGTFRKWLYRNCGMQKNAEDSGDLTRLGMRKILCQVTGIENKVMFMKPLSYPSETIGTT